MKFGTKTLAALLCAAFAAPNASAQGEEGGYVYNGGESYFYGAVYNFLKHFKYEQYKYADGLMFTLVDNYYVDAMDIAIFSGKGGYSFLNMGPGASVAGVALGKATPWGNRDLEFMALNGMPSVPRPDQRWDWYNPWRGPNGVFQGIHQVVGFNTWAAASAMDDIADGFGARIANNSCVWQSWFAAVDDERSWWKGSLYPGYASTVLYPGRDYDRYYTPGPDPPAGSWAIRIYWQD
jgi:hypothetical protein